MFNIPLLILAALLIPGLILRTKSIMSGRQGPGLFQPLQDVWVLLLKRKVMSTT